MNNGSVRIVHLVGIGGIGMSAIARLLLARGTRVTGSDQRATPLVRALEEEGATVAIGHRAENVGDATTVVVSSAIAQDNPELVAALERGIEVKTRGAMLAEMIGAMRTIAIAGTHGKTTTTAMTATILEHAGLDPTVAVGGVRVDTGSNARLGAGAWFVTESDESDGSFLHLSPTIAVITNIENDHIASDAELPRLLAEFATFIAKVPGQGRAIVGVDNPASAVIAGSTVSAPVTTFGVRAKADLRAQDLQFVTLGSRFTLVERGVELGTISLEVPGEMNVLNALAAIAVARTLEVPFDQIAAALATFRGVRRRFEIVGRAGGVTIVDDYAHHPTAVAQTIAAARAASDAPLVVAFQPHRYTRTRYLAAEFAAALAGADRVLLTPIYGASEQPIPGVSERIIGEPLRERGIDVTYVPSAEALIDAVPAAAGDRALVLMLGAGSISSIAHRIGEALAATPAPAR